MRSVTVGLCCLAAVGSGWFLRVVREPDRRFLQRMVAILHPFHGGDLVKFVRFLVPAGLISLWAAVGGSVSYLVDSLLGWVVLAWIGGLAGLLMLMLVVLALGRPRWVVPRPFRRLSRSELQRWFAA